MLHVYSSGFASAADKFDGSVVTWGTTGYGGDSGAVESLLTDVQHFCSSRIAVAAVMTDVSVVTWDQSMKVVTLPSGLHSSAFGYIFTRA